jgi:hypothetical protein
MREDEIDVDERLVRRLLALRFPRWSEVPPKRVLPQAIDADGVTAVWVAALAAGE